MNDITALAQRMKAAADNVSEKEWDFIDTSDLTLLGIGAVNIGGKSAIFCLNRPVGGVNKSRAIMQHVAACCPENILSLVEALEKAQQDKDMAIKMADARSQRIAELERMESSLRPVGVMSQAAYHRLENRESRFIALWPRPEIYLPRKRPDDGVIVYARTAGIQVIEGEQKNG
jgi:hypothetical protein